MKHIEEEFIPVRLYLRHQVTSDFDLEVLIPSEMYKELEAKTENSGQLLNTLAVDAVDTVRYDEESLIQIVGGVALLLPVQVLDASESAYPRKQCVKTENGGWTVVESTTPRLVPPTGKHLSKNRGFFDGDEFVKKYKPVRKPR